MEKYGNLFWFVSLICFIIIVLLVIQILNNQYIYLIYITITTITAPFSVLPIFIPSFAERFRTGLEKSVMENQI